MSAKLNVVPFAGPGKGFTHLAGEVPPWYPRFHQRALKGLLRLPLDLRGAYATIIELIMSNGGPLADDDVEMAYSIRVPTEVWLDVKARLIERGRIRVRDGLLTDDFCEEVIREMSTTKLRASNSGRRGAAKRWSKNDPKNQDVNGTPIATPSKNDGTPIAITAQHSTAQLESKILDSKLGDAEVDDPSRPKSGDDDPGDVRADDVGVIGTLPPIAPDSPLNASVMPDATDLPRDAKALHGVLVASAGPRLVISDDLRNSIGSLAQALAGGCEPREIFDLVMQRTYAVGEPIKRWSWFSQAWAEKRGKRTEARG